MIVTWKHANILNGRLFRKSVVPFRETYVISENRGMKPLQLSVFF